MNDAPKQSPFLEKEGHGDPVLRELLQVREQMIDTMATAARPAAAEAKFRYLDTVLAIQVYKHRFGIPDQPALTPEDIEALESWVQEDNT